MTVLSIGLSRRGKLVEADFSEAERRDIHDPQGDHLGLVGRFAI